MKRRPAGPLSALAMALTPLSIQVFAADTTAPFRDVPRSSRYYGSAAAPEPKSGPEPGENGEPAPGGVLAISLPTRRKTARGLGRRLSATPQKERRS